MLRKPITEETRKKLIKNNPRYWTGKTLSSETKAKISKAHKGKTLTLEHRKHISESVPKGKDNPAWKGGIYPKHLKIRHSAEYSKWTRAIKKRDNYICQECGCNKNLISHHKKGIFDYPLLAFDLVNGITLCRPCHIKIHHPNKWKAQGGYANTAPDNNQTRGKLNRHREVLFFSPHCQHNGKLF